MSYDGPRAYIVTAYCTDPLLIVDTSNPAAPKVTGSVHTLGGARLPRADGEPARGPGPRFVRLRRLGGQRRDGGLALRRHQSRPSPACSRGSTSARGTARSTPRTDDMKKAFQVLSQLGLILVPVPELGLHQLHLHGRHPAHRPRRDRAHAARLRRPAGVHRAGLPVAG